MTRRACSVYRSNMVKFYWTCAVVVGSRLIVLARLAAQLREQRDRAVMRGANTTPHQRHDTASGIDGCAPLFIFHVHTSAMVGKKLYDLVGPAPGCAVHGSFAGTYAYGIHIDPEVNQHLQCFHRFQLHSPAFSRRDS